MNAFMTWGTRGEEAEWHSHPWCNRAQHQVTAQAAACTSRARRREKAAAGKGIERVMRRYGVVWSQTTVSALGPKPKRLLDTPRALYAPRFTK